MKYLLLFLTIVFLTISCNPKKAEKKDSLKEALLFHASFDSGTTADYAKGDPKLYNAPNRKAIADSSSTELTYADISLIKDIGVSGGALKFNDKTSAVAYFKSKDNLNYHPENWRGTISFWLQLNPNEDLKPGFCDPIQITDVAYNDASIWVDFTRDSLRQFRLGVLGDISSWNPDSLPSAENPAYEERLVRVKTPPFSRESWTHVVITHDGLGSGKGKATLYLNGQTHGSLQNLKDTFEWDVEKSNIFLGLAYIGLFDELMIFDRPLNENEIERLRNIEKLKSDF